MKRGAWHQFGDRSQKLALEQLNSGSGVGVILSPRDLSFSGTVSYASKYRELGAEVLFDQQFYVPQFSNVKLDSYPTSKHRKAASQLGKLSDQELAALSVALEEVNRAVEANAVVAPALVYQAGRPDIVALNGRLFAASKRVGDALGIPTLATVVLGNSLAASDQMIRATLSQATSLDADGWYFAFEFSRERIPSGAEQVGRCCLAGLILASTGKPVLHAYAGPLGLISFGFGSTGAGIGHSQNLWQFSSGRWEPPSGQGGSGDAPARFFSSSLWGTVIHPDETVQLPTSLRSKVLTESPFVSPWNRWNANKHFVFSVCRTVAAISKLKNARSCAKEAVSVLQRAVALHGNIKAAGITLRDQTASYQSNWLKAVSGALNSYANDYDYLDLLE